MFQPEHAILAGLAFAAGALLARLVWPGALADPRVRRVVAGLGAGVVLASAL